MEILQRWIQGKQPKSEELEQLLAEDLKVFSRNIKEIKNRYALFLACHQEVINLAEKLGFNSPDRTLTTLWKLWLPLARQIVNKKRDLPRPFVQGILGGQGTGKTTLTAMLTLIIAHLGYSTVSLSLDDLYKTYAQRQQLQQQDPRLIWRGPPGTHDIQLGIETLDRLLQKNSQKPILIPRFDKSAYQGLGERSQPEIIRSADIILFEGWFVGVRPIDDSNFDNPPPPILTPEDKLFARDMNEKLKEYLPLWERLDSLIILNPKDYRWSKMWRKEAEQKMIALGKTGMSDVQIEKFVEYFWRSLHPELFIPPLINNTQIVDLIIQINKDHSNE